MPTQLAGAKRTDAFKFEGEEIAGLAVSPQLVRWGGLDPDHVDYLAQDIAQNGQALKASLAQPGPAPAESTEAAEAAPAPVESIAEAADATPWLDLTGDEDAEAFVERVTGESTPRDAAVQQLVHAAQAAFQALRTGEYMADAETALELALQPFELDSAIEAAGHSPRATEALKSVVAATHNLMSADPSAFLDKDRATALLDRAERRVRISAGKLADSTRELLASFDLDGMASSDEIAEAGIAFARYLSAVERAGAARALTGDAADFRELAALISEAQELVETLPTSPRVQNLASYLTSAWVIASYLRHEGGEA
jgi:hypothetical protein